MVSSALNMGLAELLETLARFQRDFGADPEYQALRGALPADWPM